MSDDALNSARLHLSEAAELAGTMASGFAMKRLTKALNRCNPISVNPRSPQGYAENSFEGNNVGAPPQSPQYSVGSYPEGHAVEASFPPPPLPVTEYPGDTIPPALPDPCQGMRSKLQACAPPSTYCPSFMGQPTGEVPLLAGTPQPLDTYSFTNQPGSLDPNRSLNDTLRQLWLRNAVQQSAQMPYAQGHKPKGPGGGQFTSGGRSSDRGQTSAQPSRPAYTDEFGRDVFEDHDTPFPQDDGPPQDSGPGSDFDPDNFSRSAYSYPQNPDGRAQGPMTAIPQGDFLGGRFGPGIHKMREQLRNCRSR